jgi:hypothetical protein
MRRSIMTKRTRISEQLRACANPLGLAEGGRLNFGDGGVVSS